MERGAGKQGSRYLRISTVHDKSYLKKLNEKTRLKGIKKSYKYKGTMKTKIQTFVETKKTFFNKIAKNTHPVDKETC